MITVFTPTYNRIHTLGRLYNSLCAQTSFDFEWLVVDDGSTDNTKSFFESIISSSFNIRYYCQDNGGKHRAINKGVQLAKGQWFFIVDSDDYLTTDAIDTLNKYLKTIESDIKYCGVAALRVSHTGVTLGTPCSYETLDTDFLSYRMKYRIEGDRAEVVRTSIMRAYPFPEIPGEKFCTEAVVWYRIAQKYLVRYVNEGIYVCEYLPGGLSDTYIQIMDECPISSMIYAKEKTVYKNVPFLDKLRAVMEYLHYMRLAKYRLHQKTYPSIRLLFLLPLVLPAYIVRSIKRFLR